MFLVLVAALALPSISASPIRRGASQSFSGIVVFGDSFSDNGDGAYRISNGTWPPTPPYNGGRFSNGPVWPEYVAGNLSIPLYDYAVGGATTSNELVQGYTGNGSTIPVPSVVDQVASFIEKVAPDGTSFSDNDTAAISAPLFVLFAGANDVFFNLNISASQSYQALGQARDELTEAIPGARILTIASPDLAELPYGFFTDNLGREQLRSYTDSLAELLNGYTSESVINLDLRPLFDDFDYYADPQKYGFDPLGKYGSCLVGAYRETPEETICTDPQVRVYWDEYHPTTLTHSWIAKEILDILSGPFSD